MFRDYTTAEQQCFCSSEASDSHSVLLYSLDTTTSINIVPCSLEPLHPTCNNKYLFLWCSFTHSTTGFCITPMIEFCFSSGDRILPGLCCYSMQNLNSGDHFTPCPHKTYSSPPWQMQWNLMQNLLILWAYHKKSSSKAAGLTLCLLMRQPICIGGMELGLLVGMPVIAQQDSCSFMQSYCASTKIGSYSHGHQVPSH